MADQRRLPRHRRHLQARELLAHHPGPLRIAIAPAEPRRAVGVALLLVELVSEFVDHHIAAIVRDGRAFERVFPGNHDLALRPGFPGKRLPFLLQHARGFGTQSLDDESARIDEDLPEVLEVVRLAIEDQQAGLRGDGDAHFVRDLEAAAADERFLGHEHLHVLLELGLEIGREAAEVGHSPVDDFPPGGGKRLRAQAVTPPRGEEGLSEEPCDKQCREARDEEEAHGVYMGALRGDSMTPALVTAAGRRREAFRPRGAFPVARPGAFLPVGLRAPAAAP